MPATIPVDETHPAALAFHAINNCAQIARGLETPGTDGGSIEEDGACIVELLVDAGGHVGALHMLLETRDRTIVSHEEQIAALRAEVFQRERILAERDEDLRADIKLRDELIAALEDDKRELLADGFRQAQTITRLEATDTENKQRLCAAQKTAEDLTRDMAGALSEITELFNRARGIQLYNRAPAQSHGVTIHEAPRMAAGRS